MRIDTTPLDGVLIIRPDVFRDGRGFFLETFQAERYGLDWQFVQDNHSRSRRGVLRGSALPGMHSPQGKLVRVARGRVFDVAVDIDPSSPTFRQHVGIELDDEVAHAALHPARLRAWLLRALRHRRLRVQVHGVLRPRGRARRALGRPRNRHRLADCGTDRVDGGRAESDALGLPQFMRVLVTGCEGQVGAELAALSDGDFRVSAFGRAALDITDDTQIAHRLDDVRPDLLVNCAAYTAVDQAEDEPDLAHAVNATAVGALGKASAERGVAIVHLSTDYVFDGQKTGPYTEDDAPSPLGVYGATKLAGERALAAANERHIVLRVSWVFGSLGRSFVDTILRLAKERDELTVVDDQVGAPSPAGAIADAIRRIAGRALAHEVWGTYHYSTKPPLSWCAFARRIVDYAVAAELLDKRPVIRPIKSDEWPTKAPRPANSRLDSTRLQVAFSLAPQPWDPHLHDYVRRLAERRRLQNRSDPDGSGEATGHGNVL